METPFTNKSHYITCISFDVQVYVTLNLIVGQQPNTKDLSNNASLLSYVYTCCKLNRKVQPMPTPFLFEMCTSYTAVILYTARN